MVGLAAAVQVSGLSGVLVILAVILFLIAAVVAWFVQPRAVWGTCIAAGACLVALSLLVSG